MSNIYKESFEKTKIAGSIAAGALDEVSKIIKPGVSTDQIDKLCYEYIMIMELYLLLYFIEDFQNLVVRQQITLFVMGYHLKKF